MAIVIYSSIDAATAVKAVGQTVISNRWNETKDKVTKEIKTAAKVRAIVLGFECVSAPEVPEAFRALVESALQQSAVDSLKAFVDSSPLATEAPEENFTRPQLIENFLQRGNAWMSKTEMDTAFTASATWSRITGRDEFKRGDSTYLKQANYFKDSILKLTGKNVSMSATDAEKILTKLEPADLDTAFGAFVTRRLQSFLKQEETIDIDAL